jgi:hypothetical protein
MFRGHRSIAIATVMSASLLTGLAVAETTVATTSEDTIADASVAATSDTAGDTSPEAAVEVLRPDASWEDVTRGEWTARAWQWWLSLPTDVNPSETNQGCGYGQAGPVYFLPIGADNIHCVVAEGTAIYVTAEYTWCSTIEPAPAFGRNEEELQACASLDNTGITSHVTINGHDIGDTGQYRLATAAFPITLPEGNLSLAQPGVALAVAETTNFIIAPPPPGDYEIVASLSSPDHNAVFTYTISVEAPQVLEAPPTT